MENARRGFAGDSCNAPIWNARFRVFAVNDGAAIFIGAQRLL
jgi:hypothetical protein